MSLITRLLSAERKEPQDRESRIEAPSMAHHAPAPWIARQVLTKSCKKMPQRNVDGAKVAEGQHGL